MTLTRRERQVCYWISEGMTSKEIAHKLRLGEDRVDAIASSAATKLKARSRPHLAVLYLRSFRHRVSGDTKRASNQTTFSYAADGLGLDVARGTSRGSS